MEIPELEIPAQERVQERNILCMIHKLTYADGRAYRYLVSDSSRQLCYVAKWTGQLLPAQTRLVEFFDTENNPVGRLQPPEVAPWIRAKNYQVYIGAEAEEPYAIIREYWRLVDILLLRLPRYEVQIGEHRYLAQGSRYDIDHFYGIFLLEEEEEPPAEEEEPAPDFGLEPETEKVVEAAEAEPEPETEETEAWPEGGEAIGEIIEEAGEEAKPEKEQVGLIQCPAAGPSYIVEADAEPLRQEPLVLAALVALIDMEQFA
jgi:hypothetical protein